MQREEKKTAERNLPSVMWKQAMGLGEGLLLQDMLVHTIIQDDICYNYH